MKGFFGQGRSGNYPPPPGSRQKSAGLQLLPPRKKATELYLYRNVQANWKLTHYKEKTIAVNIAFYESPHTIVEK